MEGRGEVEVYNVIKMINIRNHTFCPLIKEQKSLTPVDPLLCAKYFTSMNSFNSVSSMM